MEVLGLVVRSLVSGSMGKGYICSRPRPSVLARRCTHHERHYTTRVATSEESPSLMHLRPCAEHALDPTPIGQYRRGAHRSCPCAHTPWPAAGRPSCCALVVTGSQSQGPSPRATPSSRRALRQRPSSGSSEGSLSKASRLITTHAPTYIVSLVVCQARYRVARAKGDAVPAQLQKQQVRARTPRQRCGCGKANRPVSSGVPDQSTSQPDEWALYEGVSKKTSAAALT
jgi:hypothetical protein